MSRYT